MKKIISLLLSLAMLLTITSGLNLTAYADVQTGKCGDNVTYSLDTSTGVLTISGTGEMTDSPFGQNSNIIKSVIIENGVTSIGDSAFCHCKSLTNVTIGSSVTSIGESAFLRCTSLISITIPNSVTSIENEAFEDCTSLISVTIPNSVTSIGEYAFYYCISLTSVTIPNSVTSISDSAFKNCTSLKSVTIPDSVTSIDSYAFVNCTSLKSVKIPDSVTSIGSDAFLCCSSLTTIEVSNYNENYSSTDGILFNKDKSKLITYPAGKPNETYEIPDSVTGIGYYAFYYCKSLKSVTDTW